MTDLAIRTAGLSWRAGKDFALTDVSLSVPRGAVYGFLGPNGAGKSSTIRALLGLAGPVRGEVTLLGHRVPRDLPQALARIGYVPERPHLYPALTVAEMLAHHAAFHAGWDQAYAEAQRARFALAAGRRIGRLSKGEVGKLMLLLALGSRPELLILDEPTDGLDPVVRREVLTSLAEYVEERAATVFISSHLVHELERVCDQVGLMDGGRLVAEMPMTRFKAGVRRVRVGQGAALPPDAPFTLLGREPTPFGWEEWVVRDWAEGAEEWLASRNVPVREVVALDLEEVFVELLRWGRGAGRAA